MQRTDILSKIDEIYGLGTGRRRGRQRSFARIANTDIKEREQYFGATCYRVSICRPSSTRKTPLAQSRDYEEALENRNRIRKALDTLYQAEEAFANKKGA